jgi:tRNA A-37 threonylcarbamoyl transferase component Bud32
VTAPKIGDVVAERYEVLAVLGRGGMGVVYSARNRVTGREVALKWVLDERTGAHALQRLVREAQAAGRVHHPNVVDIYDVGEHEGSLFLVMERLFGRPLSDLFAEGPVAPERLVQLMLPAMRGVAAAHRSDVIHRDLKPSNIFLCQDDRGEALEAKVLDFGVSKLSAGNLGSETLSHSGAVLGTPQYMAPELFQETKISDVSADVYALGVILYRGLSGEMPFAADSYAQLVHKVATSAPRPLAELCPSLPPRLADVIMRALAKAPEERFADVTAFVRALEPFARRHEGAIGAAGAAGLNDTPLAGLELGRRPARRPSGLAAALLIVVVGALVALTMLVSRANRVPPPAAASHAPAAPTSAAVVPEPAAAPAASAANEQPAAAVEPPRTESSAPRARRSSAPVDEALEPEMPAARPATPPRAPRAKLAREDF